MSDRDDYYDDDEDYDDEEYDDFIAEDLPVPEIKILGIRRDGRLVVDIEEAAQLKAEDPTWDDDDYWITHTDD